VSLVVFINNIVYYFCREVIFDVLIELIGSVFEGSFGRSDGTGGAGVAIGCTKQFLNALHVAMSF
jgi:hypothetical protein